MPEPRYRIPRALLARVGIEVIEDRAAAFMEIVAMRTIANMALATAAPGAPAERQQVGLATV